MLVGLPGSGKSTKCRQYIERGCIIHSSDAIREEILSDVNDQTKNGLVFDTLHKRVIANLKNGKDVVYDACNIDYKRRMQFLDMIKDIECNKVCTFMATPYEICLERNKERERSVPDHVITKMYKNFTIPQYYEGWDIINLNYCYLSAEAIHHFKISNLFLGENSLYNVDQDNPHHSVSVGEHCKLCRIELEKEMAKNPAEHVALREILPVAALLHDIGKPFCKEFNEQKGHSTFYQHHLVSAYEALFVLRASHGARIELKPEYVLDVTKYIMWHMQPYFMYEEKTIDKFKKLVGEDVYGNILLLHEADMNAK
jgi:predicted kinase